MIQIVESLIIVPTYNEVKNVRVLIEAVFRALSDTHLLFVDDNSPDGTGDLLDSLIRRDARIHVLHRPRRLGIAGAYLEGFRWALAKPYGLICQMDADLSHDPGSLGLLFSKGDSFDYIIDVNPICFPQSA